jgi:nitroimidazol reductase NimA-like FMN-containing flavoprotein (pyridoxamine 5'-phosphate oxidase superfamily)
MKHEMRRADKRVEDRGWIDEILKRGQVIYLALAAPDGEPYVVPMGYGYEDGTIYLHGAPAGLKNDIIEANPRVSFNVTVDVELVRGKIGSNFTTNYRSVTGYGDIHEITDLREMNLALAILMRQYEGPHDDLTEENKKSVWVAKIAIRELCGKSSGYPKP